MNPNVNYGLWVIKKSLYTQAFLVTMMPFITGWGTDLDYCETEWFVSETNRDHSVIFENASKYCMSDSFVDYEGNSISSQGFLPTVVDKMVI